MTSGNIGIIGLILAGFVLGTCILYTTGTDSPFTFSREFAKQNTTNNTISTWQCTLWQQTTQADFQSDIGVNVSTTATPNSVILGNQTTWPSIYATTGGATTFSLYNVSNNTWVPRAVTLAAVGAGGGATYTVSGNISALRGGNNPTFWQYNITGNSWLARANALSNVNRGGTTLGYIGGGNISAFSAAFVNPTGFWIYNISSNLWATKRPTPGNVNTGGGLTYSSGGNVSALAGGATTTFWQYNISTNSTWSAFAVVPGNVGAGGALVYDNGNFIYALNGTTPTFWRYSIPGNSWSAMANIPGSVNAGSALAYDNGNYIYAFNGTTSSFWRYSISGNSWSPMANALANIAAGGSLAYVPNSSFYTNAGNLSSVVNNSGKAGTKWYNLIWSGTINPGVTNIVFQVRASDTSFLPNAAAPAWIPASSSSPVITGLPSGQYFQWQAILTTKDVTQTPVLNDVSLCYA